MGWKGKRVLVTGAGGFIGSHLVEELVAMGAKITCFLRYNSRNDLGSLEFLPKKVLKNIEIVWGDLKDSDAVEKAGNRKQVVFHLGALISIPYSYCNPRDFVQTNILGTLNILMAALKNQKLEKIILASSSEVYGTARKIPIDEQHPLQAQSPYSATKIGADKLALSFHLSFGLPLCLLRPFNTYGPRQSARAVIPTIITQLLKGDRINLGNLEPVRDFLYISDTVQGFIAAAQSDRVVGKEINIGSGEGISINNLVKKTQKIAHKDARIVVEKARMRPDKSEVFNLVCNNYSARRLLGWRPRVSLDKGLELTIGWIKDHLDFYKSNNYHI